MNEKIREKQARLDGKWYYKGTLRKVQLINFKDTNSSRTQKKVQRVLKKQKLWPAKELNLEYLKPKCFNCQFAADSKIFVKSHRRDFCKASRQQSSLICSKTRWCDLCIHKGKLCRYVIKKYYVTFEVKKKKFEDCESLPPKCSTNSKLNRKLVNLVINFDFRLLCKRFIFCSVWFFDSKIWNWRVN